VKTEQAKVGACVVDSLPYSQSGTAAQARALKVDGVSALVGYLGVIDAIRVNNVLGAGLAFIPVTLAGEYEDGPSDEIGQLRALGIPSGATVFLDLEGLKAFRSDPVALAAKINAWADAVSGAGYVAGLYVGVPQPFTSDELWKLRVQRYWRGQGSVRDRNNALAEPSGCGWCMTQMYPSHTRGGVWVDSNMVGQDYKGRVPTWVVSG
jgi:hypothetical protein